MSRNSLFFNQMRRHFYRLIFGVLLTVTVAVIITCVVNCWETGFQFDLPQPIASAHIAAAILLAIMGILLTKSFPYRHLPYSDLRRWIFPVMIGLFPLPLLGREGWWPLPLLFWALIAMNEVATFLLRIRKSRPYSIIASTYTQSGNPKTGLLFPNNEEITEECDDCLEECEEIPENIFQQFTRTRDEQGERIDALYRIDFEAGQSFTTLHLPFVPPFTNIPNVEILPLDALPLTITTPRILPQGVRIDLKQKASGTSVTGHIAIVVTELSNNNAGRTQ